MSDKPKKTPVARVKVRTVQASIWARSTESGTFFDTSFQRGYRDAEGNWKNTQSFDLNGSLALQHAVGLAIDKILELQRAAVSEQVEAPPTDVVEGDEIPY
jgi:hypothetical protein